MAIMDEGSIVYVFRFSLYPDLIVVYTEDENSLSELVVFEGETVLNIWLSDYLAAFTSSVSIISFNVTGDIYQFMEDDVFTFIGSKLSPEQLGSLRGTLIGMAMVRSHGEILNFQRSLLFAGIN